MKKTTFIFTLIVIFNTNTVKPQSTLYGLPYNEAARKITYYEVIEAENMSQNEIFNLGSHWIVAKYALGGSNPVIMRDNENHTIIVGGLSPIQYRSRFLIFHKTKNFTLTYTIRFEAREGRFRTQLSNFIIHEAVDGKVHRDLLGQTRVKSAGYRNHSVEEFFRRKFRRKKRGLAFYQFQDIVNDFFEESKQVITTSKQDDW